MKMPKLASIVNITSDSFSGDGLLGSSFESILKYIKKQLEEGAHIVDIGAISTNPKSNGLLSHEEEWARLGPILQEAMPMIHEAGAEVSVDSINPPTWEKLIDLGVDIINDQSGGSETLYRMAENTDVTLVIMHQLGLPTRKENVLPAGVIPHKIIREWFDAQAETAARFNIDPENLVLDPGIGFGNTPQQAMHLLQNLKELDLGYPIMIGHSRKSFMKPYASWEYPDYDIETLAVSGYLVSRYNHIDYLRVHNIGWHRRFFDILRHCHTQSMLI